MAALRTMTAKYDGRCRRCDGRLYAGDRIRYSRATGAMHDSDETCDALAEMHAEQEAELRMERWAESRFVGQSQEDFWRDEDYLRGVVV